MNNSNNSSTRKSGNLSFWRLLFVISSFVLLFTAFSSNVVTEAAGMKLPSKKLLISYLNKYTIGFDFYCRYDQNGNGILAHFTDNEVIRKLPVKSKAKVIATMRNCMINSFTSEDTETSMYINQLGVSLDFNELYYLVNINEAKDFFKYFAGYMNQGWYYIEYDLNDYIETYIRDYMYDSFGMYPSDETLSCYNQVLDLITIIDGKIISGSGNCIPVLDENRNMQIGLEIEEHHISVYMVTKPGTIKYKSMDENTGKSNTYKKKYISLESAIDKEMSKTFFTDANKRNMVTINTATLETAREIHNRLSNSEEMLIKIKSPEEETKKIMSQLGDMVADINDGGYEFLYDIHPTAKNAHTYVLITEDYCKVYSQCAEFYERLEKQYKEVAAKDIRRVHNVNTRETTEYLNYLKYYDERERATREAYDYMVVGAKYSYRWNGYEWARRPLEDYVGYTEPATVTDVYYPDGTYFNAAAVIKNETPDTVELCTYEEYLENPQHEMIVNEYLTYLMPNAEIEKAHYSKELSEMVLNVPFKDLSDAGKLYAIELSGLFNCFNYYPTDGELRMTYTDDLYFLDTESCSEAMQKLLDGTAHGVCNVYVEYEELIFRTLGFECYISGSFNINHAWTVLKITNNAGKEMWVPFDYGIEPSTGLVVSPEIRTAFLATEDMRYDLYLSGIEGAPNYRNFTLQDFLN